MDNRKTEDAVKNQYATARNLETRISLHAKYSMNKQGFGNWIYEQYQIKEGDRILELGCGNGDMWIGKTEKLPKGANLILSDFSKGMVESVNQKFEGDKKVQVRQINICEIPYEDNSFEVVIANMMLYHVPDLHQALSEVRRVLKKDGIFYCATFGKNGMVPYLMRNLNMPEALNRQPDSFTLQNGEEVLKPYFSVINKEEYKDRLEVTDAKDLADYMLSTVSITGIKDISREELIAHFEKQMKDGKIVIPKEYGMFVAKR